MTQPQRDGQRAGGDHQGCGRGRKASQLAPAGGAPRGALASQDPIARVTLAECRLAVGDQANAIADLEAALTFEIDEETAAQARALLAEARGG